MAITMTGVAYAKVSSCCPAIIFYIQPMKLLSSVRSVRFWRQLHLWLSLMLSLQLLAWFGSGLVMSFLPIHEVRGDHLKNQPMPVQWQQSQISPAELALQLPGAELSLKQRGDMPVYQLKQGEQLAYFSAIDGSQLQPLTETELRVLASAWYNGNGQILHSTLLTALPLEARGLSVPLWQVQFQDADNTVFYLDPILGQLLRARTDNWRLFDFVWMLHIMDYQDRDNFNNPLLIVSSASALLFTLSGIWLLLLTLTRKFSSPQR